MILVTGADGIVGRAVCKALRSSHREFVPVVRRKRAITPENAHIADLARQGALDAWMNSTISAIVHLAAAVPHSVDTPDTDRSADMTRSMDRNVHVLQEHLDVPVIYMSTCGLYGRSLGATKHEEDASQIRIESPYFSAKAEGEKQFEGNRRATLLRLSAPIGPGLKPTVVLSRFIMATRTQTPIPIWGSGSREQNFIDVRDVADLILKVLADPQPCTLNVAGQSPTTMTNLAKTVIATMGSGSYEFSGIADPREGETARYSISKARDLYDWWPKHDLEASCRLVVNEDFESNR